MNRALLVLLLMAVTVGTVVAYKDPETAARASDSVSAMLRKHTTSVRAVQVPRGQGGEFTLQARINGVAAPMVVDTGATSVVLTYETAKAAGLPLELLEYNVDVHTASGQTKAARLWLDRMAIGKLVERAVPALVVPRGQMKTNLLGMSFLDRLDGFEVRADHLMLRGFQEPAALRSDHRSSILN